MDTSLSHQVSLNKTKLYVNKLGLPLLFRNLLVFLFIYYYILVFDGTVTKMRTFRVLSEKADIRWLTFFVIVSPLLSACLSPSLQTCTRVTESVGLMTETDMLTSCSTQADSQFDGMSFYLFVCLFFWMGCLYGERNDPADTLFPAIAGWYRYAKKANGNK